MNKSYFEKSLVEKVGDLLLSSDRARNSDEYLIKLIWYYSCENPKSMSAIDLLKTKLPKVESIVRIRRRLQKVNVEMRGQNYEKRQRIAEKIRIEINKKDEKWDLNKNN